MRLEDLNSLSLAEATNEMLKCCGSTNWATRMSERRPFSTHEELQQEAKRIWWSLGPVDWLEAFRSHPKIGEKKAQQHVSAEAQKWSEQEQSSAAAATQDTMQALAKLNQDYEQRFGYIYIVCATGKSSEEMLAILQRRVDNAPEDELRLAAGEQAKITELRLQKLLSL
ncbi:MAG: 2-oxo-4-hydroxy-4-carboxy-5-ureidoimidazoline decarboxylase [Pyrinomonadaceae bacterium]